MQLIYKDWITLHEEENGNKDLMLLAKFDIHIF